MGKGYGAQDSRQPATAQLTPLGYRPSYEEKGVRKNQGPGSAPSYLDFRETDTVLGSEDVYYGQFRRTLVDTAMALRNLGLNQAVGDHGAERAAAYLDAVTWDPKTRKSYEKDKTQNTSSCGMFLRNVLWLCGYRGGNPLMTGPYDYKSHNVLTELGKLGTIGREKQPKLEDGEPVLDKKGKPVLHTVTTFFPQEGDIIFVAGNEQTKKGKVYHQHIFMISKVVPDDIVFEPDGTRVYCDRAHENPASTLTFYSVDGGQNDGGGWGCQAVLKCSPRVMPLDDGWFRLDKQGSILFPYSTRVALPIYRWIDVGTLKEHFTAKCVEPVRNIEEDSSTEPDW